MFLHTLILYFKSILLFFNRNHSFILPKKKKKFKSISNFQPTKSGLQVKLKLNAYILGTSNMKEKMDICPYFKTMQ